jgi:integrase
MATHRALQNGTHEFIVKRARLLPKPVRLYFDNYEEGLSYCTRLEALLDSNIVPEELKADADFKFIGDVIRKYMQVVSVKHDDKTLLNILYRRIGTKPLQEATYHWAESWVLSMKRIDNLSPNTVRHYVGALARCFDWASKKSIAALAINPLRLLPKTYSQYNDADKEAVIAHGGLPKVDVERDRRLSTAGVSEEVLIRRFLYENPKPENRERPLDMQWQGAMILLFELGLETAMRLRESYTLTLDQIDIERRTIFLDKTKNGHKRQVPLTTPAVSAITKYRDWVANGEFKMKGYDFPEGRVFPQWNGSFDKRYMHGVSTALSHKFKRVFVRAGCQDLGYHDLRHEATSRLFERTTLSDAEIMKITGHRSTEILLRYANLRGSDLSSRLW